MLHTRNHPPGVSRFGCSWLVPGPVACTCCAFNLTKYSWHFGFLRLWELFPSTYSTAHNKAHMGSKILRLGIFYLHKHCKIYIVMWIIENPKLFANTPHECPQSNVNDIIRKHKIYRLLSETLKAIKKIPDATNRRERTRKQATTCKYLRV